MDNPLVADYIAQLKNGDDTVRERAVEALGRIGDASAVPALITRLGDKDDNVRRCAIEALTQIGLPAIPALIAALVAPPPAEWKAARNLVRKNVSWVFGRMGDLSALPRKILAESRWSAQERVEVLDALRRVRYRYDFTILRYDFPDTLTFCQMVRQEADAEARTGAQAVLHWLNGGEYLLRPSQQDTAAEAEELLRASQGGTSETPPDELLRGANQPDENPKPPSQRPTLRQRLFGKQKDSAS